MGAHTFFPARTSGTCRELGRSDGSEIGTVRVAAPWVIDGTEEGTPEGTTLVREIVPGPAGSHVCELPAWGGRLVFTACSDEAG